MLAATETRKVFMESINTASFLLEVRQQFYFIMFICRTPYTAV